MNDAMNIAGEKNPVDQATKDLLAYAFDREDVKWLMEKLHQDADINRTTVEYELQVLKIISTGWAISYHLEGSPNKNPLLEQFWKQVFDFSNELSKTTNTMTGTRLDYFEVLKERLEAYVTAISKSSEATAANDPGLAVGPEFAGICGNSEDLHTRMAGITMFATVVTRVGAYLTAMSIPEESDDSNP